MRALALALAALTPLLFLPIGCGGGGGGTPVPTTDAFVGTYGITSFSGWIGPPLTATAHWGEMWPDGRGTLPPGLVSAIQNGTLLPPGVHAGYDYALTAGGRMEWTDGLGLVAAGGLSSDGRLGTVADQADAGSMEVYLLARRGSGYTQASLDGTYHFAYIVASPTGTGDGTTWGAVAFNGAGGANYTLWSNIDGTVGGPTAVPGTYVVMPDGELTLILSATTVFSGTIIRGGDIGIFSGSTVAGGAAAMGIFLKYSTAASDATFSGAYHTNAINASRFPAPSTNWTSATGTLDANGAGQFTQTTLTLKTDGGTVTPIAGPFLPTPYAVSPNGGMTVGTTVVGAVSSDGRTAALVGGTLANTDPLLWVVLR